MFFDRLSSTLTHDLEGLSSDLCFLFLHCSTASSSSILDSGENATSLEIASELDLGLGLLT